MGMTHVEAAARLNHTPPPATATPGAHRSADHIDRARTDALELRGIPAICRGVPGAMRGTTPGSSVKALEAEARDIANASHATRRSHMRRARRRLRTEPS